MQEEIGIVKTIGNFVSNLLLGQTKEVIIRTDEKVGRIEKDVEKITENMGEVKGATDSLHYAAKEMQDLIERRAKEWSPSHRLPQKPNLSYARSPITLNETGKKLLKKSGMDALVDSHINDLLPILESKNLPTAFDVQNSASSVIRDYLSANPKEEELVKDFLFNNPKFEGISVDMTDMWFVGALRLRDAYFKKHPSILTRPSNDKE